MNTVTRTTMPAPETMNKRPPGFILIEGLVAILIFCLGVLGMVAMGSAAVSAQSDARYRTDAAAMVDELANKLALNVDRSAAPDSVAASVATFQHQSGGTDCNYSGSASTNAIVSDWINSLVGSGAGSRRLPGLTTSNVQILTQTTTAGGLNKVQITVCWQAPTDTAMRHHTLVTYVN